MDLDYVLTFVICATALAAGRVAIKTRAYRWMFVQVLNLAVLGLAWLFARGHVAAIAGPVWGLSVLAPGLATTMSERYSRAEKFRTARVLARIAASLHPNAATKMRVRLAEVQELEVLGKTEEAREALASLKSEPSTAVLATLMTMRLDQRWADVRALLEMDPGRERLDKDAVASSFYMRALGETGDVDALLETYARVAHTLPLAAVEGQTMLFAAAFGGAEEATSRILRAHHADMPEDGKRLWMLTAAHAAGKDVIAELDELAKIARPRVAAVARLRRDQPAVRISEDSRRILAALDLASMTLEPARAPHPTACVAIAAVNLYAFAREVPGGTTNAVNLHSLGALFTGDILLSEWYRLGTAAVLHYGGLHVAMNLLGLLVLGTRLEAAIGRARLVVIYVLSGFGANALAVVWTRYGSGAPALLVGASGAVMGVAGALLVRRALRWRQRRTPLARREVTSLVVMFVLQIGFDAFTPHVAGAVHLFGAGVGAVLALILARPSVRPAPLVVPSVAKARAVTAVGVLVACGLVELAFRAASSDYGPNGECAEGDIPSCAQDCAAQLGPDVLDAGADGASLTAPRFGGTRGAFMFQSCNRYAYAVSNMPGATDADMRRAYAIYAATCDAGSMLGCTNEGVMLDRGEGVRLDPEAASDRFARACDAGHARGCTYLGDDMLRAGKPVEDVRRLLLGACDAGDDPACQALRQLP